MPSEYKISTFLRSSTCSLSFSQDLVSWNLPGPTRICSASCQHDGSQGKEASCWFHCTLWSWLLTQISSPLSLAVCWFSLTSILRTSCMVPSDFFCFYCFWSFSPTMSNSTFISTEYLRKVLSGLDTQQSQNTECRQVKNHLIKPCYRVINKSTLPSYIILC